MYKIIKYLFLGEIKYTVLQHKQSTLPYPIPQCYKRRSAREGGDYASYVFWDVKGRERHGPPSSPGSAYDVQYTV